MICTGTKRYDQYEDWLCIQPGYHSICILLKCLRKQYFCKIDSGRQSCQSEMRSERRTWFCFFFLWICFPITCHCHVNSLLFLVCFFLCLSIRYILIHAHNMLTHAQSDYYKSHYDGNQDLVIGTGSKKARAITLQDWGTFSQRWLPTICKYNTYLSLS